MDWVTGIMTLIAMELIGRKHWQGWCIGIGNQGLWLWLIYDRRLYGLLPLTAVLTWRYAIHLIAWREQKEKEQ